VIVPVHRPRYQAGERAHREAQAAFLPAAREGVGRQQEIVERPKCPAALDPDIARPQAIAEPS
jgi:hypothetical protein